MYTKSISPAFTKVGKRNKLTGYLGQLYDGETLIHSMEYSTNSQAEAALDALAFELLTDLAEQGLIDELPAFDPSTCVYCHNPHNPSECPEMRAMLFAPSCVTCGNAASHHVSFADAPHDAYYCDTCIAGSYFISTDLRSNKTSGPHAPIDVDFAPTGFEV